MTSLEKTLLRAEDIIPASGDRGCVYIRRRKKGFWKSPNFISITKQIESEVLISSNGNIEFVKKF